MRARVRKRRRHLPRQSIGVNIRAGQRRPVALVPAVVMGAVVMRQVQRRVPGCVVHVTCCHHVVRAGAAATLDHVFGGAVDQTERKIIRPRRLHIDIMVRLRTLIAQQHRGLRRLPLQMSRCHWGKIGLLAMAWRHVGVNLLHIDLSGIIVGARFCPTLLDRGAHVQLVEEVNRVVQRVVLLDVYCVQAAVIGLILRRYLTLNIKYLLRQLALIPAMGINRLGSHASLSLHRALARIP